MSRLADRQYEAAIGVNARLQDYCREQADKLPFKRLAEKHQWLLALKRLKEEANDRTGEYNAANGPVPDVIVSNKTDIIEGVPV